MKVTERWDSERMQQPISLARWGHYGTPVLVFPTAGGDAEEIERNHLVGACWELVDSGRVKLYSCDSVAGRALATGAGTPAYRMWLMNQYHQAVVNEVVPAIFADLGGPATRDASSPPAPRSARSTPSPCSAATPTLFDAAIAMSGTYRLQRFLEGQYTDDLYFSSPLDFLPHLDGPSWTHCGNEGHPGLGRGRPRGHRRVLGDGRSPRWQGRAQPGGLLGP